MRIEQENRNLSEFGSNSKGLLRREVIGRLTNGDPELTRTRGKLDRKNTIGLLREFPGFRKSIKEVLKPDVRPKEALTVLLYASQKLSGKPLPIDDASRMKGIGCVYQGLAECFDNGFDGNSESNAITVYNSPGAGNECPGELFNLGLLYIEKSRLPLEKVGFLKDGLERAKEDYIGSEISLRKMGKVIGTDSSLRTRPSDVITSILESRNRGFGNLAVALANVAYPEGNFPNNFEHRLRSLVLLGTVIDAKKDGLEDKMSGTVSLDTVARQNDRQIGFKPGTTINQIEKYFAVQLPKDIAAVFRVGTNLALLKERVYFNSVVM